MLIYIIGSIVLFIALPIITGMLTSDEWVFGIELARFKSNSFEMGITNRTYHWDNEDVEQELRIGLLLITFSFSFFRNAA